LAEGPQETAVRDREEAQKRRRARPPAPSRWPTAACTAAHQAAALIIAGFGATLYPRLLVAVVVVVEPAGAPRGVGDTGNMGLRA